MRKLIQQHIATVSWVIAALVVAALFWMDYQPAQEGSDDPWEREICERPDIDKVFCSSK